MINDPVKEYISNEQLLFASVDPPLFTVNYYHVGKLWYNYENHSLWLLYRTLGSAKRKWVKIDIFADRMKDIHHFRELMGLPWVRGSSAAERLVRLYKKR